MSRLLLSNLAGLALGLSALVGAPALARADGNEGMGLQALVEALRRLPGVGVKSASRMAFHMLQHDRAGTDLLARALQQAAAHVRHCDRCNTFTEGEICSVCLDPRRDATKLCVVETPADDAVQHLVGVVRG